MKSTHMLTIHLYKEGRTTVQFFPSAETAHEQGRKMQATFACDTYVSEILSATHGER